MKQNPAWRNNELTRTAIEKSGGLSALSRHIGITRQAISQWDRVPAEQCRQVSEISGVPLHELRPDIYPEPVK